jgi:regulator of replication initiation timing
VSKPWRCDRCGALQQSDGLRSYGVEEARLRLENDRLRAALREIEHATRGAQPFLNRIAARAITAEPGDE